MAFLSASASFLLFLSLNNTAILSIGIAIIIIVRIVTQLSMFPPYRFMFSLCVMMNCIAPDLLFLAPSVHSLRILSDNFDIVQSSLSASSFRILFVSGVILIAICSVLLSVIFITSMVS